MQGQTLKGQFCMLSEKFLKRKMVICPNVRPIFPDGICHYLEMKDH